MDSVSFLGDFMGGIVEGMSGGLSGGVESVVGIDGVVLEGCNAFYEAFSRWIGKVKSDDVASFVGAFKELGDEDCLSDLDGGLHGAGGDGEWFDDPLF